MNKIDQQLTKIKQEKRIGIMTHVIVGYPSLKATVDLVKALEAGGSDFVELQIPFSDPIADGPTIMRATEVALRNGSTVDFAFETMKELSATIKIPLIFMGYYNTVFNMGVEKFCQRAAAVGASGMIIPDIPPEEEAYDHFIQESLKNDLYPIRVISPASTEERLRLNAKDAKGFVYCISRYGVTGAQSDLDPRVNMYIKSVSKYFKLPKAVGFGISKKAQIEALKNVADIAIMGSVLVDLVKDHSTSQDFRYVTKFLKELLGTAETKK